MDKIYYLLNQVLKNLVKHEAVLNNEELFAPVDEDNAQAGVSGVDFEQEMVFGQTSAGREGGHGRPIPGNDEDLDEGLGDKE